MRKKNCGTLPSAPSEILCLRRALATAAALALVLGTGAAAQVLTTTVQGNVYRADGTPASGTVLVSWNAFTTPQDQAVAAGNVSATIGANGFLSVNLTPNADALPSGSYYTAVYHLSDGTVYPEYWVVPASGTASVASVRAELEPATRAVTSTVTPSYVQGALASLSTTYLPLAGGTLSGMLTLSGDPAAVNQAATKHYVDQSTAQALPLTGGNIRGAVSAQKETDKLPRIDITHPDFGSGCANAADPTGTNDSTCAIQAAIAFQESEYAASGNTLNPALYFPQGLYKISSELVIPCSMPIIGDGSNASVIQQTGAYATGVKIVNLDKPSGNYTCAATVRGVTIEGNGTTTWGTLLEIQNSTGYAIEDVRLSNTAGRGIETLGSERGKIHNLTIDAVRWPAVFAGDANETHWTGVQINNPGTTGHSDCYEAECGASYLIPAPAPSGLTLATASVSAGVATFTMTGATCPAPWTPGQNVQLAGPWGLSGHQAVYNIAAIGCSSGTITMTAPAYWGQTGTASVSGATILTAWAPPQHAAVMVQGSQNVLIGDGSIKALQVMNGFQEYVADGVQVNKIYFEGYPVAGTSPRLSHSIVAGVGVPYIMQISGTTSAGTTTTVPWSQGIWGISWYNDIADVSPSNQVYDQVRIYPPDGAYNSATMSAYQSGVEQGQYEVAGAVFSPNGSGGVTVTLVERNLSGSTAPANTAWVANSLMILHPTSGNFGANFQVTADHLQADAGDSESGYYQDCSDTMGLPCAEAIVGSIPNGITDQAPQGPSLEGGLGSNATFRDTDLGAVGSSELLGQQAVKNPSFAQILFDSATGFPRTGGEVNPISSGTAPAGPFDYAIYSLNYGISGTAWNWFNPNLGWQSMTLGGNGDTEFYYADAGNGMVASSNNLDGSGSKGFADFLEKLSAWSIAGIDTSLPSINGWEYGNKECHYDQPSSSSAHALSRWCLWGGPGYSPEMEYDTWSGSAWAPSLSATSSGVTASNLTVPGSLHAQGAMAAAAINGEITVDGQTYVTLNDAWKAASAQATATGQDQTVRLGPGSFAVAATLSEPANGACVNLLGSAGSTVNADSPQVATTLTVPNPLGGDLISLGNAQQAQGCTFQNLSILASGNATHAFELQWFRGLLMENVAVNDTSSDGIVLGEETPGHQSNFLLRNVSVSYSAAAFTPASRPSYGIHVEKTAIDSALDEITVRNAFIAAVYNEGTGNTGYLIHGFGYPYTCTTAPCANNASSETAANASYASSYVIYDTGGGGSEWTDTYVDSPAVAGFYVGANGVSIDGGHIQWPDLTSFPAANLAWVASSVTNNLLIADVSCLGMASGTNWITYAGPSGNPPSFSSVHHLTGCGNYYQALEPAVTTGFSSGGANIDDPSSAVPRVWATPLASAATDAAYSAQMYTGYQGDVFQAHFSGVNPFFNITSQGTIRSSGGLALSTIVNNAAALTLTTANKNVIANAAGGPQTITLPSCYTPLPDKSSPTGLEFTIIKSDASSNAVTLQTVSSQNIEYNGASAQTLVIASPGKRTLVCGPDYNWYAY